MSATARIDVHQHLLPPEFIAALERHGLGRWAPTSWNADAAIEAMDRHAIATGMLSLSTPGPHLGDDAEARLLAREINEFTAGLVRRHPQRFGMFAAVPLPDLEGALDAISYAYDHLEADGVVLLASMHGRYLGDPVFEPVMAELDRRAAVVLVHPTQLGGPPVEGLHPSLADFLLDTTRAAINLVLRGIPRRYPNIRIILSHAGGFLPYAAHRIANLSNIVDASVDPSAVLEDLSSFFFDTALAGSPTVLPSLLKFARPGHILFGSDFPYARPGTIDYFTSGLDEHDGLDAGGHAAINAESAKLLFPRLSGRQA